MQAGLTLEGDTDRNRQREKQMKEKKVIRKGCEAQDRGRIKEQVIKIDTKRHKNEKKKPERRRAEQGKG